MLPCTSYLKISLVFLLVRSQSYYILLDMTQNKLLQLQWHHRSLAGADVDAELVTSLIAEWILGCLLIKEISPDWLLFYSLTLWVAFSVGMTGWIMMLMLILNQRAGGDTQMAKNKKPMLPLTWTQPVENSYVVCTYWVCYHPAKSLAIDYI